MAKYVARRIKADEDEWWEDDYYSPLHVPVVDDADLQPTGLIDRDGTPLWRIPNPIGFGRKLEW